MCLRELLRPKKDQPKLDIRTQSLNIPLFLLCFSDAREPPVRQRDDRDAGDAGGGPAHQLQPGRQRGQHAAPPRRPGTRFSDIVRL